MKKKNHKTFRLGSRSLLLSFLSSSKIFWLWIYLCEKIYKTILNPVYHQLEFAFVSDQVIITPVNNTGTEELF